MAHLKEKLVCATALVPASWFVVATGANHQRYMFRQA